MSGAVRSHNYIYELRIRASGYLQGRASTLHSQLPLDREQLAFLLLARPHLAQSVPYSMAVKLAQERIAARRARDLLLWGPLVP